MARRLRARKLPSTVRQPAFHRRHPWATALVLVLAVLVWLGRFGRVTAVLPIVGGDMLRYHQQVFEVVNVVDGDTIDVDIPDRRFRQTRIRLWGVGTPEVAGSRSGEMHWGAQASRFASRTLLHKNVRLELIEHDTRDKYERLLAFVYVESSGAHFNELLLSGGHAYADMRFSHPYRQRFRELETEARSRRVGLWRDVVVEQMPRWRQKAER